MDFQASFAVAASKCILLLAGGDPAQHLRNTLKLSHPDWQRQLSHELRHEEVFPIYGKGEAQFLPYMGKSARQGLAALTLYG